jgi:uncharacterized protein (TIGR03118 family)
MHGDRICRLWVAVVLLVLCVSTIASAQHYTRVDLTANTASTGVIPDPNLVNAWGLSRASGSPWWISDNGTGLSTLYDLTGAPQPLVVTIPPGKGQTGPSAPTGTVFNYTGGFEVGPGAPAIFLFVTENGTIAGWNPGVNPTVAVTKKDRSDVASYKGMALATTAAGPRLYATNFKAGTIEVFNDKFQLVNLSADKFHDPNLPRNYVPFNIQNVGGNLVVTFARRTPGEEDEDHGAGLGYVTIFNPDGKLLLRLQHGAWMNAPWGVALAPSDFGPFAHRLLIGNFGDGTIHAFNAVSGKLVGTVLGATDEPLMIDGLWAISFAGGNARSGSSTELYFTAGPNEENDGLFGKITATATENRGNTE